MKTLCLVCQNVDCKNRGSEQLMGELQKRVEAKGLADVEVKSYMCFGACQEGPNIVLYPEKNWYAGVKVEDLDEIVAHLAGGPHVQRLDTIDSSLKELIYQLLDTGVF
ncbi:MAG TPA: (2Fe-2S) ferredoxin domain-containing protein [Candidatus Binatia bacterium]|nr:(2Fe-2S) ferredoxin domain-containing protein [Candidatus Binatia bacterium]